MFIYEFENTQFSFPFGPFWSVKYLGQLIIILLKVGTLRLLKIYIMPCPPAGAKYSFFEAPAHGLTVLKIIIGLNSYDFFWLHF